MTALQVKSWLAKRAGKPGRLCAGEGVYLITDEKGRQRFVLRFSFQGKVTEAGLGGHGTTLAEAREAAIA